MALEAVKNASEPKPDPVEKEEPAQKAAPSEAPKPKAVTPSPPAETGVTGGAGPAVIRGRHRRIFWSFLIAVVLPFAVFASYLWGVARDQYVSSLSFSVRTENAQSALDLLGGVSSMIGSSPTNDVDILEQFVESQDLVGYMEERYNVSQAFSIGWPEDFMFAYDPEGTLEDLHKYWNRNVRISTDSGLITLSVRSYDPELSREISLAVYEAGETLVNQLSQEARDDATRHTREDLHRAEERLKTAREEMTQFRLATRIVDPMATLQAEIGILSSLQAQMAETLVQRELRLLTARETDPRLIELNKKIEALQRQIDLEQGKFANTDASSAGKDYATLFSQYERLAAERKFAEESYRAAMVAHDVALMEAKKNSRYLAMHVKPTVAQKSLYPDRPVQLAVTGLFLLIIWAVGLLIYYSIRDRR